MTQFTSFEKPVVTTGTNTAYQLTLPAITALSDFVMHINFHTACGNSPTIQINALGVKYLKDSQGNNVTVNAIKTDDILEVAFDVSKDCFEVIGSLGGGSSGGGGTTLDAVLGETVLSAGMVSLMPDSKLYKLNSNYRSFTGQVTGQSSTQSCLLPNNKIATVGINGSTLTVFIGTIDYDANSISFDAGTQVTTNCQSGLFYIAMADTDSFAVIYGTNGIAYGQHGDVVARACTCSSGVVIGPETILLGHSFYYGTVPQAACHVAPGKVACSYFFQDNGSTSCGTISIGVSGTTITNGGGAGGTGGSFNPGNLDLQYVADNIYAYCFNNSSAAQTYLQLISVSGLVPTAGGGVVIGGNGGSGKVATDGTNIYAVANTTSIYKFSYSGNTLSYILNFSSVNAQGLCMNGKMLGALVGTSLVWYSDASVRNTTNFGFSLAQLGRTSNYSLNYNLVPISGNPTTFAKISNETRYVIGYMASGGTKGDIKTITIDGGIITGLSNIIPGEVYYINSTTGVIGLTGDVLLGRGLPSNQIKISTTYTA